VLVFARECRRAPFKEDQIVATVEPTCRRVSITDRRGHEIETVLHLLREDKDAFYLFICNTGHTPQELKPQVEDPTMVRDRKAAFPDVRIRGFTGCKGRPVELCPDSGNMFLADASADASGWEIRTSLPPCGSRLFVIPKSRRLLLPAQKRVVLKKVRGIPLRTRQWEFALSECNNLVLDHPRYRIGDGGMRNEKDILGIDDAVRKSLGLPRRWGLMVQPWARPKPKHARGLPVTLEYTFAVKEMPASEIFLGIENPRLYEMRVNDAELPADAKCGWWTDRSLRKIPIDPSTLKPGRNTITLTCDYDSEHPGLECIYLLGNFGAEVRGTRVAITALPRKLKMGDWVRQGLPFYSGSVAYVTTIAPKLRKRERLFVRVPEYRGTCVRMLVDGREAGIIGWEPNEVELTDFVGNGRAELRIQVVGHRRNSHGPLHYFKKWPYWCAGDAFAPADHERIDAYQLVPCGLMKPPSLIVRAPHRR
jgi:hypothetical protein